MKRGSRWQFLALLGAFSACDGVSEADAGYTLTSGGGGGVATSTGGGTASVTCRELSAWASTDVVGAGYGDEYEADGWYYDWVQVGSATVVGTSGNGDYLSYEFWADSPTPSLPSTGTLAGPYSNCEHCVFVYEDCTDTSCARHYLGQSGNATVTAFSAEVDAGFFEVTLTDVTLVEWDTTNDAAIAGGQCLHLGTQHLSATW